MKSNPQGKRYIPVSEYQRISGLSNKTVMYMIRTGQIPYIKTESGHCRIDTQPVGQDTAEMKKTVEESHQLVKALCKQFNVAI
ncbi:MAG: hypothetical protein FWB88_13300 [Defluviitaleaceae bacterium]|nr:hypothetical protein [Defluviitaleaceae bacterium]MCL2240883.1 hypothetical protein [Defluviitaleaceae bacterium]